MGLKVASGTAHILLQVQVGTVVHSQGKLQSNASVSYNGHYDFITNLMLAATTQYVNCTDGDVRLIGGQTENQGSVQVCYNNAWTYLCSGWWWGTTEANIVCGQLGFNSYGNETFIIHYNQFAHYN